MTQRLFSLVFISLLFSAVGFSLTGHSEDIVTITPVSKQSLQNWLPDELALEETTSNKYPLFMNYGKQKGVGMYLSYLEMSVKVPRVHFKKDPEKKPHNFYKVLYMNNHQAVFFGIVLYDSPKIFAPMTMNDHLLTISSDSTGQRIFEADFHDSATSSLSFESENYKEVAALIGHNAITYKNGSYKCWGGDRKNASIKPLRVDVSIYDGYIPGLEASTHHLGGLDEQKLGGFVLTSDWTFNRTSCPK